MCIRDRDLHLRQMERLLFRQFRVRFFVKSHVCYFSLLNGCLLYTSDAADERSSVDLGGRRIIKTKKNSETVRGTHSATVNPIK